ncbi:MAG: transglutaminase-like domain-containing protein [Bacteroidota bacterium]
MTISLADKYITDFDNRLETIYKDGDTDDIISVIKMADGESVALTSAFAKKFSFNSRSDFKKLWTFVKRNITYKADTRGHEVIKSPAALWKTGVGDCKSFSIFIASILNNHGIPVKYRFVSYEGQDNVTHVYPVAIWQGREIILDAVHTTFDDEVPYVYKKEYFSQSDQAAAIGYLPTEWSFGKVLLWIAGSILLYKWIR